jgi:deoxycytidylate deaminase
VKSLSDKFIGKYMRMAKQVGEDHNPCYSRQLGVVLVKVYENERGDVDSRVVSTGYNGPPKHTPHCDDKEYLKKMVWPQLSRDDQLVALQKLRLRFPNGTTHVDTTLDDCQSFGLLGHGCKTCPRKLIGAPSGTRLELCSCEHAEKNAIVNATEDLHGCYAFCWCGVACFDCTKLLINAGIRKVYFIDDGSYARNGGADYSFGSRQLFEWAGIPVDVEKPDVYFTQGRARGI